MMADAFARFWHWAEKPLSSMETIPADLHRAVMEMPEEDRRDQAKVNEAYRRVAEAHTTSLPSRKKDANDSLPKL